MRYVLLLSILAIGCTRKVEIEVKGFDAAASKVNTQNYLERVKKETAEKEAELKRMEEAERAK